MDKKTTNKFSAIAGYAIFVAIFALLVFARFTYGTFIKVDGMSMYPTFQNGGFVLATILHEDDTLQSGDVVVLEEEGVYLIKRIHACPGESTQPDMTKGIPALTMGEDEYYVLGDNWENSRDSRYFGAISRDDIKFKFADLYWTRAQVIVGVFIPMILLIGALTIVLIPADKPKRKKVDEQVEEVDEVDDTADEEMPDCIFAVPEMNDDSIEDSVDKIETDDAAPVMAESLIEEVPVNE